MRGSQSQFAAEEDGGDVGGIFTELHKLYVIL